ncbi:MAG: TATA-box-binding protein [Candidatus Nanohalarchaeota archaeon]|nr:MAG: TATA-box-binding protein [Candidatus Nanohaloarchaeota archaeon]
MAKENDLKVHNVVVSTDLHCEVPLEKLANNLDDAEYEPEVFPGLVYRTKDPKANYLIFSTGKIICSGTKSFKLAQEATRHLIGILQKQGISITEEPNEEIVNMVASGTLNRKLVLNKIAFSLDGCEYEPESFPGLILRLNDPHVVFLLFNSGKIVCTGARSEEEIERATDNLEKKIKENNL